MEGNGGLPVIRDIRRDIGSPSKERFAKMRNYDALLIELRLLADRQHDKRSLVAIAAQFERDSEDVLRKLSRSIQVKKHNRRS
jgi:hypothetical protein